MNFGLQIPLNNTIEVEIAQPYIVLALFDSVFSNCIRKSISLSNLKVGDSVPEMWIQILGQLPESVSLLTAFI